MHVTFIPPCFHVAPLSLFPITYLLPPHPMLTRCDFPLHHSLLIIHSVTHILFLYPSFNSSLRCRFCLPPRADAAFIAALLLSLRRHSIHHRATAPFIIAPPVLPLSLCRYGLLRRAAVPFLVTPPVLSSSLHCRCLCHRASALSEIAGCAACAPMHFLFPAMYLWMTALTYHHEAHRLLQ